MRAAKNTKKFDLPDPIAVTASPEYDALAWRERQASIVDDRRDQSTAKASAMVLKAAAQSPSAGRPRGSRRRAAPRAEAGPTSLRLGLSPAGSNICKLKAKLGIS